MTTFDELQKREKPVAVVGLGYVGLPLAVSLAKKFDVIGFDVKPERIRELREGKDHTREVDSGQLDEIKILFTDDPEQLRKAGVIIIAVPTPIDRHRNPDLEPLVKASRTVGQNLSPGTIVVYESTVYPGVTEDICVPELERESGLKLGSGFGVGYSPERINPGDKKHTFETITKIVSGSDPQVLDVLTRLYGAVVTAGIHPASSIKVAEAAKVIENTQRDLNIALMNELAIIFGHMGLDTGEILEAAGSKWNFLPFRPGLVGGHCIGVDPYYLTFKAEELGFHPEVILAGRRINDRMGKYVAESAVKKMIGSGTRINGSRVGILGLTFKENVPDLRNSRVVDLVEELKDYGVEVLVSDAHADPAEAKAEYGIDLVPLRELRDLDALILAVSHAEYASLDKESLLAFFANPDKGVVLDVKGFFDPVMLKESGLNYWRL